MAALLVVLTAARTMTSGATRLKYAPGLRFVPQPMTHPMMHHGSMIQTPVNFPQLQMKVSTASDDDMAELRSMPGIAVPLWSWKANISDTSISPQTFPPKTSDMDAGAEQLLGHWADSFMDPFEEKAGATTDFASLHKDDGLPPPPKTPKYSQVDKAMVLHNMRDVIARSTSTFIQIEHLYTPTVHTASMFLAHPERFQDLMSMTTALEMVGLMPQHVELPSHPSQARPSPLYRPVLALGVFSRGHLRDDDKGSLRRKLQEKCGNASDVFWRFRSIGFDASARKKVGVFAIHGLADAPGLPERSARVLLSKIAKYAEKEDKIVVVPQQAYMCSDGTDLTGYYERLGFEKVEMEGRLHELIYTGTSSLPEDRLVEDRQIMVDMHLWTGV